MSNSANLVLVQAAIHRDWYHIAAWLMCLLRIFATDRILWSNVFLLGDKRILDFPSQLFLKVGRDKRHSTSVMVDVPDELAASLLK